MTMIAVGENETEALERVLERLRGALELRGDRRGQGRRRRARESR